MNDKTEYQYPQTEHGESDRSVNDVQIAEARQSTIEAFAIDKVLQRPEAYENPQAIELLTIGQYIEASRPSDYELAA
jgi:hypothetical protein